MRAVFFAVFACACARTALPPEHVVEEALPANAERYYTVSLGGARVGSITETETWFDGGVVLRRVETMRFLRGDALVSLVTTIVVNADRALVPTRVTWTEQGATKRTAVAARDGARWSADNGTTLPGDAVPAELVPLVVRRDGHFDGRVFLAARGFLVGHGRVEPVASDRLVAMLALDHAQAEATIDIDPDRTYTRIVDGEGVIASRATQAVAAAKFEPVDLIAATSVPITGHGKHLVIDGDIALPPVPGQAAKSVDDGIEIELSPQLVGGMPEEAPGPDRTKDIRSIVSSIRASIVPDLHSAGAANPSAGDCTTFALAYAARATKRSIPTRVVTGLRVDGDRLIRHRWAVSWTGSTWIAVDAAFGAAPAGGDLIGLAVHDADDAGLVAGEAALTMVRSANRR